LSNIERKSANMNKTLKIRTIVGIYNAIEALRSREDLGKKLVYALVKTKGRIQPVIDAVAAMQKAPEGLRKYDEERLALAKRLARKDEAGKPVVKNNNFEMEDPAAFESEMAALRAKYRDDFDRLEAVEKELQAHLDESEEVDLHPLTLEMLPDAISFDLVEKLSAMLEEPAAA
jgi:hypothetical protein